MPRSALDANDQKFWEAIDQLWTKSRSESELPESLTEEELLHFVPREVSAFRSCPKEPVVHPHALESRVA